MVATKRRRETEEAGSAPKRKETTAASPPAQELKVEEEVVPAQAYPIVNKPIPKVPPGLKLDEQGKPPTTIVLFYQYIEPRWSPKDHKAALAYVTALAKENDVTGRGRCAAEGLNCTLTGTAENVREFCQGLRDWNPIFKQTDFKFTDGLPWAKRFKAFTLQKKQELVAYGLPPEKAPSLAESRALHLDALEYHKMMASKDAVIIDVRNFYETQIGHFQPPPGGAELIDPKMRNSHEFPKWLNLPETQEKLRGKKVMMYCTGGIRCERATALLSQIEESNPDFKTQGVVHVRGGIERYMRTFPEGGYWKGKNFLFDRRYEQVPEKKTEEALEKDVESCCCVCKVPWGKYRGGFKCREKECQVPVIVCDGCSRTAWPNEMRCPLCEEGFSLREYEAAELKDAGEAAPTAKNPARPDVVGEKARLKREKYADREPSTRIFVGALPLVIDAQALSATIGGDVKRIRWIPEKKTGLFYGSTFVEMNSLEAAKRVVAEASEGRGLRMGKRRLRVSFAPLKEGEEWPPPGHVDLPRPPVPVNPGC